MENHVYSAVRDIGEEEEIFSAEHEWESRNETDSVGLNDIFNNYHYELNYFVAMCPEIGRDECLFLMVNMNYT